MIFWINLEHSTRHLLYVTECMVNGNAWALRTICVYLLGPYLSFFPNTVRRDQQCCIHII